MWQIKEMIACSCLLLPLFLHNSLTFDRSGVELQHRFYSYSEPEPEPNFKHDQFLAKTKFGTYYGAAANPWFLRLLPKKNKEVFPLSKAEVQGKPAGISVYDARKALNGPTLYQDGAKGCVIFSKIVAVFKKLGCVNYKSNFALGECLQNSKNLFEKEISQILGQFQLFENQKWSKNQEI